jgi:hypothetical protein
MTNKEKIILIIRESLKFGHKTKYQYGLMLAEHKRLCTTLRLRDIIEEKIALFNNIDENSELYRSIYETAKIALVKLQIDECYNFHSAALLLKIFHLETVFNKKLKSNGHKIVDISETKRKDVLIVDEQPLEPVGVELVERKEKFIPTTTTGKKLVRDNTKRKEIVHALLNGQL